MDFKKIIFLVSSFFIFSSSHIHAKVGTESGGGGDASEARVNEIRNDILKWIENDGASDLIFSNEITYDEYYSKMIEVLQSKKVIISFTSEKVIYANLDKTCKSFIKVEPTERMHILCNISRFENTSESDQYKLIHHEYAGLMRIEKNDGAASDYNLSSQITDYLAYETILKLSVKNEIKKEVKKACSVYIRDEDQFYLGSYNLTKLLKKKNLKITSRQLAQYTIEKLDFACNGYTPPKHDIPETDFNIFYCNQMNAKLNLLNTSSGEMLTYNGSSIKSEESRPTPTKALTNLLESMPRCKK